MFILYIHINFITLINKILINKINFYNIHLIWLNNLRFNYIILFSALIGILFIKKHNFLLFNIFLFFIREKYKHIDILKNFYLGFYKVHPTILYTCLVYLITHKLYKNLFFKNLYNVLIFFSIITFLLGSLWALVNSTWGYYWTSDVIEFLLLILIILIFIKIHNLSQYKQLNILLNYSTIIINLNLLKFNFFFTKHSFIILNNNNKFLNFYLLILCVFLFKLKKKKTIKSVNLSKYFCFLVIYNLTILINLINKIHFKQIIKYIIFLYILNYLIFFKITTNLINKYLYHSIIFGILINFNNLNMLFYYYFRKIIIKKNCINHDFYLKQINFNTYLHTNKILVKYYSRVGIDTNNLKNNSAINNIFQNKISILNYF